MIRILMALFLLVSATCFTQIELQKEKLSFHDLVEWKGVLVIAEDDKKKVDFKELTLINPEGEIQWRKVIYPKSETSYLIHSNSSDYIYFVDDLEPVNNMIRYNQVNESGSVTSTKLNVLTVIRNYGYRTPDDVRIENIVNTPNALVFHLSLEVDDKEIIENFFVTITHHNNRVYHMKGPETRPERVKEGKEGPVIYAGCDKEGIYFARYTFQANNHRVNFIPIDSKAKPMNTYNYSLTSFHPIESTQKFYSNEGRYYINHEEGDERMVRGLPVYTKGQFLYIVNDAELRKMVIYGANESGEIVKLNKSEELAESSRKYDGALGLCRNESEVTVFGGIEEGFMSMQISGDTFSQLNISREQSIAARKNPSILEESIDPNFFVYHFSSSWYSIDKSSLDKQETIVFSKK